MLCFSTLAVSLLLITSLSACGDNQQPAEARMMWQRLLDLDYKNTFARAPGYEERRRSRAPHGDRVDIYVDPILQEAIEIGMPITEWPLGSLVVKDGWDNDGDFDLVAAMEKREDGWFYVEWTDRSGDALYSGRPDICVDCHRAGDDFIRAFPFPADPEPMP